MGQRVRTFGFWDAHWIHAVGVWHPQDSHFEISGNTHSLQILLTAVSLELSSLHTLKNTAVLNMYNTHGPEYGRGLHSASFRKQECQDHPPERLGQSPVCHVGVARGGGGALLVPEHPLDLRREVGGVSATCSSIEPPKHTARLPRLPGIGRQQPLSGQCWVTGGARTGNMGLEMRDAAPPLVSARLWE